MQKHKCAKCGERNTKLYRSYGSFLRDDEIFCGEHVENWDWYVPLIEDVDGTVWGYTSIPDDAIAKWKSLPGIDYSYKQSPEYALKKRGENR